MEKPVERSFHRRNIFPFLWGKETKGGGRERKEEEAGDGGWYLLGHRSESLALTLPVGLVSPNTHLPVWELSSASVVKIKLGSLKIRVWKLGASMLPTTVSEWRGHRHGKKIPWCPDKTMAPVACGHSAPSCRCPPPHLQLHICAITYCWSPASASELPQHRNRIWVCSPLYPRHPAQCLGTWWVHHKYPLSSSFN